MRYLALFLSLMCVVSWITKAGGETMETSKQGTVRIFDTATQDYITVDKVVKTDGEWKKLLTPEQYKVTRGHGTERAFCGLPTKDHKKGVYKCVACGTDLFLVGKKFEIFPHFAFGKISPKISMPPPL